MKKIIFAVAVLPLVMNGQVTMNGVSSQTFAFTGPINMSTQPLEIELPNTAAGTITGSLVKKVDTAGALQVTKTAITDTNNALGCVQSGAGTSGTAQIAVLGTASCLFDNVALTDGDFIVVSTSTAGTMSDAGTSFPTGALNLGVVKGAHASCGSPPCGPWTVLLMTPDALGAAGTGILAVPSAQQTIQPSTDVTGLSVKQSNTANTADVFDVVNKSGVKGLSVNASGVISLAGTVMPANAYLMTTGALVGAANTYYVSPLGNDSWSGLLPNPSANSNNGPFKTITKAFTAVHSGSVKTITLRGGLYSSTGVTAFTFNDNGTVWIAYPGETPIIDGGTTGTFTLTGVNTIAFYGITFQNLGAGAYGGWTYSGLTNLTARWNTFLSCNKVCIGGQSLFTPLIDSNTFNGVSPGHPMPSDYSTFYSAINPQYETTTGSISHNLFLNIQGGAVAYAAGLTDPGNLNQTVDRNVVINTATTTTCQDCAALYFYDPKHAATGNSMTNNYVYGMGDGSLTDQSHSFYLDQSQSNITVSGNTCHKCGESAVQIHGGDHVSVTNNIFDLTGGAQVMFYQSSAGTDYGMAVNALTKNIIYSDTTFPATLYNLSYGGDAIATASNNMYFSANSSTIPNTGIVDSSRVLTNPGFTNPAIGDYSMASTSPAFLTPLFFVALPVDEGPLPYNPPQASATLTGKGNRLVVTADFATAANTSLQVITGLAFTLPAFTPLNVPFQCHLAYSQATAAAAVSFGIGATVAPTNIFATGQIYTSATALTAGNLPTLSTTTATAVVTGTPSAITTVWDADIDGFIENPSVASNTISVYVKTATAGDAVTVKRGSFCVIQ